jgi:hypothetical protein
LSQFKRNIVVFLRPYEIQKEQQYVHSNLKLKLPVSQKKRELQIIYVTTVAEDTGNFRYGEVNSKKIK